MTYELAGQRTILLDVVTTHICFCAVNYSGGGLSDGCPRLGALPDDGPRDELLRLLELDEESDDKEELEDELDDDTLDDEDVDELDDDEEELDDELDELDDEEELDDELDDELDELDDEEEELDDELDELDDEEEELDDELDESLEDELDGELDDELDEDEQQHAELIASAELTMSNLPLCVKSVATCSHGC
jgi:DNA repair exonuclease SbcCD ATPase subunit